MSTASAPNSRTWFIRPGHCCSCNLGCLCLPLRLFHALCLPCCLRAGRVFQDGFAALHRSCVTGKVHVIEWLLAHGAGVNLPDAYGDSPLHYAAFCGHQAAVRLLLKEGADPLAVSEDGKSPLDSAREENHAAVANLLEEAVRNSGRAVPDKPTSETGAGFVAGLDFSTGVVVEGTLFKKRANRIARWRKKYYVLSSKYQAMFFWTGSRTEQEGVIKKVRYETFLSVRHFPESKEGRRFDVRVITGRTMEVLANSQEEALQWINALKQEVGQHMAVLRVQAAWRGLRARRRLQAMIKARREAISSMREAKIQLPAGFSANADGVVLEGVLKKKNTGFLVSLFAAWRTRYFVLNITDALLYYYENKAKRNVNAQARSIPIIDFYWVRSDQQAGGKDAKRFHLKVMQGRVFTFAAQNKTDAARWIAVLQGVLPREYAATVRIQSFARMVLAKAEARRRRNARDQVLLALAERLGKPAPVVLAAIIKVQAAARGMLARRQARKLREAKEADRKRAEEVRAGRVWLHRDKKPEAEQPASTDSATAGRLARLKAIREKKEAQARAEAAAAALRAAPDVSDVNWDDLPLVDANGHEWQRHTDDDGDVFYANAVTGDSTWDNPGTTVGTIAYPYTSAVDEGSGNTYYINAAADGATDWEVPPGWEVHARLWEWYSVNAAAAGRFEWQAHKEEDGDDTFYTHIPSARTQWTVPAGWAAHEAWAAGRAADAAAPPSPGTAQGTIVPGTEWVKITLPENAKSSEGHVFWYDPAVGTRRWKDPTLAQVVVDNDADSDTDSDEEVPAAAPAAAAGPTGWERLIDEASGRPYWYNHDTGESQWHEPGTQAPGEGADPHEVLALTSWAGAALEAAQAAVSADAAASAALAAVLPLDPNMDPPVLFSVLRSGVMLALLVNQVKPDALDTRVLEWQAVPGAEVPGVDGEDAGCPALENCVVAVSAATSAGVSLSTDVGSSAEGVESGATEATLNITYGLWLRELRLALDVRAVPELMALALEDEKPRDVMSLKLSALLLRWWNHHIKAAGAASGQELAPVAETGAGPAASIGAWSALLHSLAPEYAESLPALAAEEPADEGSAEELANQLLGVAFALGVPAWFSSGAITGGIARLQLALLGQLFLAKHGLELPKSSSTEAPVDPADLAELEDDPEGEREDRVFMAWINSLGCSAQVTDLAADCRDGVVLLQVLNAIEPGIVNWRKANKQPKNRYHHVENANYIIDLGKAMEFHLVNVGGIDIVDANRKLMRAYVWQAMRYHTLKILSAIAFDGFSADEGDILSWANEQVTSAGGSAVSSFKDSSLGDAVWLLRLLHSVRPVVNWELVSPGSTEDERAQNAKYAISVARKLGAAVFCTWEDIVEVRHKMIMTLAASTMLVQIRSRRARKQRGSSARSSFIGGFSLADYEQAATPSDAGGAAAGEMA